MLLSFAHPYILCLLLGLLFLPRGKAWLWRFLSLGLLIIALAGPQRPAPNERIAVLIDVSDSVGQGAMRAAQAFDFSQLAQEPLYIAFASDSMRLTGLGENLTDQQLDALGPQQSDISRALQVAAANNVGRTLLISDGLESSGNALEALPQISVDSFGVTSVKNVRLLKILAPDEVRLGDKVEAIAVIESDTIAGLRLAIAVDGEPLDLIEQDIPTGRSAIPFSFIAKGVGDINITARLSTNVRQPLVDDTASYAISVSEDKAVLVIGDRAMAELLRLQGLEVIEAGSEAIQGKLDYSTVILRSGVEAFSLGQLELLSNYVKQGGGLMMTGGSESFGLGNWYRTPLEAVLPVNTDLRSDVEVPLVALVIVLDRSQSMQTGRPSKIELAKEGAISVVDLAYQEDLLGLITFSDREEWVFPLRKATSQGRREMAQAILNIATQGGTVLEPAYREAISALNESEAAIKHIIILSDGQLYDGGGPFGQNGSSIDFPLMAQVAFQAGITTSTIAIGDGADFERLEQVARSGRGRYYSALDISTLPQIFTSEALTAKRSLLREGELSPSLKSHPLLMGLSADVPSISAYIATTLKPDSEVLLGLGEEPLLSISRQALGRSAALTTDLNSAWAGDFSQWQGLSAALSNVVRWLQTRPAEYSSTVRREGNGLKVVVDAIKEGQYINGEDLSARYEGLNIPLSQSAPGRYEAFIDAPPNGGTVLISRGNELVARGAVNIQNGEFDKSRSSLLQDIARQSGGEIYSSPGLYNPPTPNVPTPMWPYPALAALGLFAVELFLRRFRADT
ncbi:MAG: VWA domain-containing protein [Deinococcales bacterium]